MPTPVRLLPVAALPVLLAALLLPPEPAMAVRPDDPPEAASPAAAADLSQAVEGRNRLENETSPYLLQHRHNPVHWWPWGPEAFEAARAAGKPIFLSIGYSTCYWCHVMERESFENADIAAIMNEHFVCIKVDREERPDVDDIYMTAVQALNNGRGGWPMSVFLEPEHLQPFLAGTYFPPNDGSGRPGFPTVMRQVHDFWTNQQPLVVQQAERVAQYVRQQHALDPAPVPVGADAVEQGVTLLLGAYDPTHGGFGRGNKFPMPANLDLLLDAAWEREDVHDAIVYTLDRMATGGLFDQVGGGFHRYTVDEKWLVPHFEKMLYDNGQLAVTYADAYERTGDAYYAEIIRRTLDWVLREMTAPEGGFFSAQDAETNHREGESYLWTPEEVRAALGEAGLEGDADFALEIYGLDAGPNFRDPHHPGEPPKNVVHLVARPEVLAARLGMDREAFDARRARVNTALLAVRDRRDQPGTDDKVLAGWNGLMIAGLAEGGRALDEPRYLEAASKAAHFVLRELRDEDGNLLRTWRGGRAKIPAFMEDHAYLVHGLLALHRATGDDTMLAAAADLAGRARSIFHDESGGGYFDTRPDQDDLFVRIRSTYDGATPSANGVMLHALLDLHARTGEEGFLDDAVGTLGAMSHVLASRPTGAVVSLRGLHRMLRDHPGRVPGPTAAPATPQPPPGTVTVTAVPETLALAPGAAGVVEITLEVPPGHHINAHEPGPEFLVPLRVTAVGVGIAVGTEYPPGEAYDGPVGRMTVHHGTVTIPVTIRRTGELDGKARLLVQVQVCTDEVCMAPENLKVPVTITAAE